MLHLRKKKENTCRYHYQKSLWYDIQFLRYRAKQTEIGNFRPFRSLTTQKKSKFWKDEQNCWRYHYFKLVWQKHDDVRSLRYEVRQTKFFVLLDQFLPFYPSLIIRKTKVLKKWKKHLEISWSYAIMFLGHNVWHM